MKEIMTVIALFMAVSLQAQEIVHERKWHFEADLRYQHMFFRNNTGRRKYKAFNEEKQTYESYNYKINSHYIISDKDFPNKYGGNTLVLMETYNINRRLTAGLGLTYARYNQEDENGINFVASLRYKPWSQHPYGYFYTELGLGPLVNLGWGTSVRLSKHRRLDFKIGYDMQCINSSMKYNGIDGEGHESYHDYYSHAYMHCLQGSIGIVF